MHGMLTLSAMKTHPEVIALWPSPSALARDVGLKTPAVRHWKREKRIPIARYDDVLAAAEKRGFEVTYAELTEGGRV